MRKPRVPTPQMMHHVEISNLREEAPHGLLVLLAVSNGSSPEDTQ